MLVFPLLFGSALAAQLPFISSPSTLTASGAFVSHFSGKVNSGQTGFYLQSQIKALYAHNQSVLVSQEYQSDLVGFGKDPVNKARVSRDKEGQVTHDRFIPVANRREGEGSIREIADFASYEVEWQGEHIKVITAALKKQQHFISSSHGLSRRLLLAVSIFLNSTSESVLVFDQSEWSPSPALYKSIHQASWADVILDQKFKNRLENEFPAFIKSEKTYKELGIPWKRGVIFRGPAGNGKTITLKAILRSTSVPILYVKSFHTYGGDEYGLKLISERARSEAPCILVLEDLDSLITSDNRAFFLNELDGLEDNDGLFMIGTTNHFEKLDPAISNRPSRFDRKYDFPNPCESERELYATYWQTKLRKYDAPVDFPDSLVQSVASTTEGFSFAYLKEIFISSLITLANTSPAPAPRASPDLVADQIEWLRGQLDAGIPLTGKVTTNPSGRHGMNGGGFCGGRDNFVSRFAAEAVEFDLAI